MKKSVKTTFICFHDFVSSIRNINNKHDNGCLSIVKNGLELKFIYHSVPCQGFSQLIP